MAAMLSRLGGRGYQLREDQTIYGDERHDFDFDGPNVGFRDANP